jgi:hypothetical protein
MGSVFDATEGGHHQARDEGAIERKARGVWKGAKSGGCLWGFGVYCGGSGEVASRFFWLAEALPQSKQSNRVVFKAAKSDPAWDFKKGDYVLNIRWLERVDEKIGLESLIHMAHNRLCPSRPHCRGECPSGRAHRQTDAC